MAVSATIQIEGMRTVATVMVANTLPLAMR
jgi:hypothetical protein